ncbi:hypothetical protein [Pontibacter beigongshangensis]|uniref:hypothetical protein n=1 Tax=Pontibacter beigongshangensis TaxID=2574733 RepID=UPI0016504603|nr:hypothetical protein [Pontibacter beigongshangensis]
MMIKLILPILLWLLLPNLSHGQTLKPTPAPVQTDTLQHESEALDQWKRELLGQYAQTESLTANTIRPAYINLVESARSKRSNWSAKDWEHAKAVLKLLDDRKREIGTALSRAENNRINALQEDFTQLQAEAEM